MRHSSYLEVDLSLLAQNMDKIKGLTQAKIIPMVKADAYGHGLIPISRFLVEECGVEKLGSATLSEALKIFEDCPTLKAEVIVFSDTEIQDEKLSEAYHQFAITPVVHQVADLERVLKSDEFRKLPLWIKVNTGMNRLGLSLDDLERVSPRLKNRGVKHLMTHFATSYYVSKDGDKMHRQIAEFEKAKKILSDAGVEVQETSVANSGAIEQRFGIDETYVRPGLMMYGPPSVDPRIWDGHQISRLVTKVIKTFSVKKGTPVGYGINVAGTDGFMIVVALGYGDGLMTFASGVELTIKGFKGKIFGRVNMDMAFIMFDPSAEGKFKNEEMIEIWNHDNRVITDIANQMKTHQYQLMCGITNRIPRFYKV